MTNLQQKDAQAALAKGYAEAAAALLPGADAAALEALLSGARAPSSKSEQYRYTAMPELWKTVLAPTAEAANTSDSYPALLAGRTAQLVFTDGHLTAQQGLPAHITLARSQTAVQRAGGALSADTLSAVQPSQDSVRTAAALPQLIGDLLAPEQIDVTIAASDDTYILEVVSTAPTSGKSAHPKLAITLEKGAKLLLLQRSESTPNGAAENTGGLSWLNDTLSLTLKPEAALTHVRFMQASADMRTTSRTSLLAESGAHYCGLSLMSGTGHMRHDIALTLMGDGVHATNNGVLLSAGTTKLELNSTLHHSTPNGTSDQVIRSVAADQGTATFQGKIHVAVDAQHTEADQSSKALLLSRTATANARPELEIFADDVKCSHGATVGELDKDALFYLTARGIDPKSARRLLIEAFAADAFVPVLTALEGQLDGESLNALSEHFSNTVSQWMDQHHAA